MTGKVISGKLSGTEIEELSFGSKMQWKDWVARYPNTEVLSVNGQEDGRDAYANYFRSERGFRNSEASDRRLETKEPVFTFHHNGKAHAIPLSHIEGGWSLQINDLSLFLYRPENASMFQSTHAFESRGNGFVEEDGKWIDRHSKASFDAETAEFAEHTEAPKRFRGFDTFWYNWSLNNPDTKLHVRVREKKK